MVWVGAGFSKFGKHFSNVIPPMVSNTIFAPKWVRRAHYRDFPRDLRPSRLADFMAHVNGTTVEIAAPLVLFFSTNKWVTLAAVRVDGGLPPVHHLDVPARGAAGMERGLRLHDDLPVPRLPELERIRPVEHVAAVAGSRHRRRAAVLPGAGQPAARQGVLPAFDAAVRGQLGLGGVGFRAGCRAEAGPGHPLGVEPGRPVRRAGYEPKWAEITLQRTIAWRSMHSQGRGLFSLLLTHLPDIDVRTVREGEFVCNSLIGFNFGDGHLHDADMIRAVQREAAFEPGECVIAWVESEAFGSGVQHYQLIDAALGVIERGTWKVADAVAEQPWLPNGPIPTSVEWSLSGSNPAVRKDQEHGHGALA